MKAYIILVTFLFSLCAFAEGVLDEYSHVQIRPLPGADKSIGRTFHAGIFLSYKSPSKLGLYGVKRSDSRSKRETYELLGEVEMTQTSSGAILNFLSFEKDSYFTLSNIEGSQLDEICGDYHGIKAGFSFGVGATGFSSMNRSGIILRSSGRASLFKIDLSRVQISLRCIGKNLNPNWKSVVRF